MKNPVIELPRSLCIIICSLVAGGTPSLAQSICDPSKPIATDPWDSYRQRTAYRCEGVYRDQPISGDIIGQIASLTVGKPSYQLDPTPLRLEWPSAVEGRVYLRAIALREDLRYQMDAAPPAGASSFVWPTGILLDRKIEPEQLGIRAWVVETLLGRPRPLHLPLRVRQGDLAGEAERGAEQYWLVVVPGAVLRKLEFAIDRLRATDAAAGEQSDAITEELAEIAPYRDVNRQPYPAKRAVRFPLPALAEPGNYLLRLRAEREDGAPDTDSLWFAHVVP